MIDVINILVGEDHFLRCTTETIAREGEGLVPRLVFSVPESLSRLWAYLDFKMPNGEKYKTARLGVANGELSYDMPAYLLQTNGTLEVQLVFQNEGGLVWKSYVKKYNVRYSVNAVDDIPQKEDFIVVAQNLLDAIIKAGAGGLGSYMTYVDLFADKWVGENSPYSQEVYVDGATENSKVDLSPTVEQLSFFHDKDVAFVTENEGGVVTVYCIGQKPVADYTIQATITEVFTNG